MSCMLINALYATFSRSVTTCIMTAQVSSRQKHQSNIRRKDGELQEEDSGCWTTLASYPYTLMSRKKFIMINRYRNRYVHRFFTIPTQFTTLQNLIQCKKKIINVTERCTLINTEIGCTLCLCPTAIPAGKNTLGYQCGLSMTHSHTVCHQG